MITPSELASRTLDFIEVFKSDFGVEPDRSTGQLSIRAEVTSGKVRGLYEDLLARFPREADYLSGMSAEPQRFAGFYHGRADAQAVATHLGRYGLYTERIIITNPFCDWMADDPVHSPLQRPEPWTQIAINQGIFLATVEPWIRAGIVQVMPPLSWFESDLFLKEFVPRTQRRLRSYTKAQEQVLTEIAFDEFIRYQHPDDVDAILTFMGAPPSVMERARDLARLEYERNPLGYRWTGPRAGHSSEMVKQGPGNSLESALYTAAGCGAYLLLGAGTGKQEFDWSAPADLADDVNELSKLSRGIAELKLRFLDGAGLNEILRLRQDGRLSSFRAFLLDLWSNVGKGEGTGKIGHLRFKDALEAEYATYKNEWKEIDRLLAANMVRAAIGAGVAVLSGNIGFSVAGSGWAAYGLEELVRVKFERNALLRRPLGVFLELDRDRTGRLRDLVP